MRSRRVLAALALCLATFAPGRAFAAMPGIGEADSARASADTTGTPPPADGSGASTDSVFHVTADRLDGRQAPEGEIVVLTGNVVVTQGTLRAAGDRGEYRKAEESVLLEGNVRVSDREFRMRSRAARYDRLARRLTAEGDVYLSDGTVEVRAPHGEYWRDEDRAELTGGCVYREEDREIRSDRMTWRRGGEELVAEGNVVITDPAEGVRVEGRRGIWDTAADRGLVTGRPRLVSLPDSARARVPPDSARGASADEPYEVVSDTLYIDRGAGRVTARGHVEFTQGETSGSGDEAVFLESEDTTEITGTPVIRHGKDEVRGNRVRLARKDGDVDHIMVIGAATGTYTAPDSLRGNEVPPSTIRGDSLDLDLDAGELAHITSVGKAAVRYYPPPPEGKAPNGEWNETQGDTVRIRFAGGQLRRVEVRGTASGVHHLGADSTRAPADTTAPAAGGGAPPSARPDSSSYRADAIDYDIESDNIDLRGSGEVTYGTMRLTAGEIRLNSETRDVRARAYPVLYDGNQKMIGRVMTYNLDRGRGSIFGGEAGYEKGFYDGQVIRKQGEDVLAIDKGRYTSCDREQPHYGFRSRRMKVYVGDRVIAKPIILYVGRVPVFALPFFVFPIAGDRRSGILIPDIEFGSSQSAGRFVRHIGYYWVPNDYADVKVWGDYFERQRWVGYLETRYKKIYLLDGSVNGSYQREMATGNRRWDLAAYHRQQLGENMTLTGRANFVSDVRYRQDIVRGLDERLNRELRSDLSIAKRWESANLNVAVDRRENLDTGAIDRTLPKVSASLLRRPFFGGRGKAGEGSPWYRTFFYDTSGELSNASSSDSARGDRTARSLSGTFNLSSQRAFGSPRLSYRGRADEVTASSARPGTPERAVDNTFTLGGNPRLWGWLELGPSVTLQETWFSGGAYVDSTASFQPGGWRKVWQTGGSARTNLYGTFFPRWGRLVGVRHVMTPSLSFTYQPAFPEYQGRFQSVGGVSAGTYPGRRRVDLGLGNNLHLKVRRGDKTENLNNVASLQFNSSYDFRWRDAAGRTTGWDPLRSSLTVQPGGGADLRLSATHRLPDWVLTSLTGSAGWRLSGKGVTEASKGSSPAPKSEAPSPDWYLDPLAPLPGGSVLDRSWSVGLSQRYTHTRGGEDSWWFDGDAEATLLRRWRLSYSTRVNMKEHDIIAQEWSLYRDLHCWEVRFTRAFSNEDWRYFFRINIKAHPEIHAERGSRDLAR